ncbi:glycosyltransferase family 39 protein [Candidatus Woesearchaeota archaeon]|nr:glycosyltransferase family 39 protein [Candidatus Woesearchaeota archaeon]
MKLDKHDSYIGLAIAVIVIGALLRFILAVIATPASDGCWFLNVARYMAVNGKIPLFEHLGRDIFARPPLLPILAAFFYKIFGVFGDNIAVISMRLVSPIFGSLTLLFSFLVIKKIFNSKLAFYSVLFLSFIPMHLVFSSLSQADMIVSFFVLLSIYFLLNNKIFLSGTAVGLATLSKETGFLILILLFYLLFAKYKADIKLMSKKAVTLIVPFFVIVLPWFIRNYTYLKNPIWPFFSSVIGGVQGGEMSSLEGTASLLNIFYIKDHLTTTYLGVFGVPNGEISNLFFFNLPFIKLLLIGWFLATLLFVFPFILGLFKIDYKSKKIKLLLVWFLSYFLVYFYHIIEPGKAYPRFLLPAFTVFAVIWSIGFNKISNIKIIAKPYLLLIILCVMGFISASFVKTTLTNNEWNAYKDDFRWVVENTEEDAKFITEGQCITYQLNRETYAPWQEYDKNFKFDNNSYVWVNQNFRLERLSILPENTLNEIEANSSFKLAYFNEKTGTKIYHYLD